MSLYDLITMILKVLGPWAPFVVFLLFAAAVYGAYRLAQFILAEDPWRSFWGLILSLVLTLIIIGVFLLFLAILAALAPPVVKVFLGILKGFSEGLKGIDYDNIEPIILFK